MEPEAKMIEQLFETMRPVIIELSAAADFPPVITELEVTVEKPVIVEPEIIELPAATVDPPVIAEPLVTVEKTVIVEPIVTVELPVSVETPVKPDHANHYATLASEIRQPPVITEPQ